MPTERTATVSAVTGLAAAVGTDSSRATVVTGEDGIARCAWSAKDPEYRRYHDEEWGTPLHEDQPLFEKLSLEGFQAGLSWLTILRRRPAFRSAFSGFDIQAVAAMTETDAAALLHDAAIIRNRAKIAATISNARITLDLVHGRAGAFSELLWSFTPEGVRPIPRSWGDVAAVTAESTAMSKALRKLGYRFVGPTTLHALMQSCGMIDDHFARCWRSR
ncbi:MAG: DNA-3-methyladenine glycosylase [Microbacteriaceae bacterium]|jgi:DNA-3-methyladenine glycosylase I|nr:DNA-3-methyladenine glycosylase [Microbacteriaceae bacterium]HEV7955601.1 DNA-3-methyladenine glycosylase I [Marisediminicola sp.]